MWVAITVIHVQVMKLVFNWSSSVLRFHLLYPGTAVSDKTGSLIPHLIGVFVVLFCVRSYWQFQQGSRSALFCSFQGGLWSNWHPCFQWHHIGSMKNCPLFLLWSVFVIKVGGMLFGASFLLLFSSLLDVKSSGHREQKNAFIVLLQTLITLNFSAIFLLLQKAFIFFLWA